MAGGPRGGSGRVPALARGERAGDGGGGAGHVCDVAPQLQLHLRRVQFPAATFLLATALVSALASWGKDDRSRSESEGGVGVCRTFEQIRRADVRDCEVLEEKLADEQCTWDGSFLPDLEADIQEVRRSASCSLGPALAL